MAGGATEIYRGNKQIFTTWPSGSPTASAIQIPGYAIAGLTISGALNSGTLTLMTLQAVGASALAVYDRAAAIYTAAPPANGTGIAAGWSLDSNFFAAAAGYSIITVSGAPQTAAGGITAIWQLKG